jgi:C4-dicarboxylate-specific signal transduction histidine kinase
LDSSTDTTWHELAGALASIAHFELCFEPADSPVQWSPQMRAILGVDAVAAPLSFEQFIDTFVLVDDRAAVQRAFQSLRHEGREVDVRYRIRRPDDDIRWLRNVARVCSGHGGRQAIGLVQDQSEQKLAEQNVQANLARVQSFGRWSLVGEIASGIAHELNQPLAAITTFAHAGERFLTSDPPRLERAIGIFRELSQEALRAGDIIRRMRSLVKKQSAHLEPIDCTALIADFLLLIEPLARTHNVSLTTELAPATRVLADATQIQQALLILFRNAIDAIQEASNGAPRIKVATQLRAHAVEFSVTDSGPGVSDEVAKQLFKPFFTTKEQGTGLDLLICGNIVAMHGSRLEFANVAGGGCRFYFLLPRANSGENVAVDTQ